MPTLVCEGRHMYTVSRLLLRQLLCIESCKQLVTLRTFLEDGYCKLSEYRVTIIKYLVTTSRADNVPFRFSQVNHSLIRKLML